METVTLTIDGRQVTVGKGSSVLQAALENGVKIPYFCYHPDLRVEGSCRVCLVKIEKMPKLQTACSTACADGMVVYTSTPEVVEARAGVFELLLVNHPLDCPVCDKGGECPLQDYSYACSTGESRTDFPRRTFDGEGVRADVDFGPTLMLNRNRCILCTRCVRFMREVDGDAQISVIERGYGSKIATFGEEGVHSLLSGNLMDVCPVGAITTKDYRFKTRPWDNASAIDTICTFCSKGCNTTAWLRAKPEWARSARLMRLTPRFNGQVNGYWMCDIGRFEYHWIEGDQRVRQPLMRDMAGVQNKVAWSELFENLSRRLTGAGAAGTPSMRFLISAHASLEELFLVRRLAAALKLSDAAAAVTVSWRRSEKRQPPSTKFKVPAIDAPNVTGAQDFGLLAQSNQAPGLSVLRQAVERGQVAALYVCDPGPAGSIGDVAWIVEARDAGKLPLLIVQGVLMTDLASRADFLLPGAVSLEKEATYTNDQGLVQAASRVVEPPGEAMEDWRVLVKVAASLGIELPYISAAQVRADLAANLAGNTSYAGLETLAFGRTTNACSLLETSNPSERWKWNLMFQDLPPVKGASPVPAIGPANAVGHSLNE